MSADVANGGRVVVGGTVSFTATPAAGAEQFFVGAWSGDGGACELGRRTAAGAEVECDVIVDENVIVNGNVSVAVVFHRYCLGENRGGGDSFGVSADGVCTVGACANNTYHDVGGFCVSRPELHYSAEPPVGGAGTVAVDAVLYTSSERRGDEFVGVGATVTFIATPGAGFFVAEWRGEGGRCAGGFPAQSGPVDGERECEVVVTLNAQTQMAEDLNVVAVFSKTSRDCAAENRAEHIDPGNPNAPPDTSDHLCGVCAANHSVLRGLCLPVSGHYDEDEFTQREVCELLGGVASDITVTGNPPVLVGRVCEGADADGTFCILDSPDLRNADNVFPCRGLFRRVLRCNLAHERPALNPFTCGPKCAANQTAQGAECRDN